MNLYTYVNFAEDETKKPEKKKSFLRKHWKKLALGAVGLGVGALGAKALYDIHQTNKHNKAVQASWDERAKKLEADRQAAKAYRDNSQQYIQNQLSSVEAEIQEVKQQLQQYIDAERTSKLNPAEQAAKVELHSKLGYLVRKKKDLLSQVRRR